MLAWTSIVLTVGILNLIASTFVAHPGVSALLVLNGGISGLLAAGLGIRMKIKIQAGQVEQLRKRLDSFESRVSSERTKNAPE